MRDDKSEIDGKGLLPFTCKHGNGYNVKADVICRRCAETRARELERMVKLLLQNKEMLRCKGWSTCKEAHDLKAPFKEIWEVACHSLYDKPEPAPYKPDAEERKCPCS